MKKLVVVLISIMLLTGLILVGCAGPAPTAAPSTVPATTAPTAAPKTSSAPAPQPTAAPSPTAAAKTVEISYITFLPRTNPTSAIIIELLTEVEKRSAGKLVFKYRGGPEAIPPFDQITATRTGVVDMVLNPTGYYIGLTAAPSMISIAETPAAQDLNTGAYDYLVEIHQKVGIRYLTRGFLPPGDNFSLISKKPIAKPTDFAGLKMSGAAIWEVVGLALGMKTVAVEQTELYTAMERGIVDVAGAPVTTFQGQKMWEIAKYLISPAFFSETSVLLMNLNKWNTMPKETQDFFIKNLIEIGTDSSGPKYAGLVSGAKKAILANGVQDVTFSGADADWYISTLNKAAYDYYVKLAPVEGPKLYSMLKKDVLKK